MGFRNMKAVLHIGNLRKEDLYMLGACTILSGEKPMRNGYASTDETIAAAVHVAKRVWKEVIKQNKENDSDE
jgi:hypothetical protein